MLTGEDMITNLIQLALRPWYIILNKMIFDKFDFNFLSGTTKHSSHVGSAPGLESKEEPNGGHCF